MLAYYTSLIKKEELYQKFCEDGERVSLLANDLVCELKSFTVSSKNKNVEDSLQTLKEAEELSKIVSAIVTNLKNNYESYVSSLVVVPKSESSSEEDKPEESDENQVINSKDNEQLSSLLEAVKSLKEMKDSLDK